MTKPKAEQLSLGRQFCNWAYDNCWKIIEIVVWTAVSIGLWNILVNRSKRSVSKIYVLAWVYNSAAYRKR